MAKPSGNELRRACGPDHGPQGREGHGRRAGPRDRSGVLGRPARSAAGAGRRRGRGHQHPAAFEVDVEGMEIGASVHARDLNLPAGVTLVVDSGVSVLHVLAAPTAEQLEADLGEVPAAEAAEEVPPSPEEAGEAAAGSRRRAKRLASSPAEIHGGPGGRVGLAGMTGERYLIAGLGNPGPSYGWAASHSRQAPDLYEPFRRPRGRRYGGDHSPAGRPAVTVAARAGQAMLAGLVSRHDEHPRPTIRDDQPVVAQQAVVRPHRQPVWRSCGTGGYPARVLRA